MAFLPVQIPPGIVRGANPDDNPGRWYNANLVRWRGGTLEPIRGWSKIGNPSFGSIVRKIFPWRRNSGVLETLFGAEEHLYSYNDAAFTNVTPANFTGFSETGVGGGYGTGGYGAEAYGTPRSAPSSLVPIRHAWSFGNWGEDVVTCSSSDGRMFYFDSSSPGTAPIPFGRYSISSISRTSNVVTVTTTIAHNMTSGESATIAGVTDATYNATATITVTGATTFTYANTGSNGSSSGGTIQDNTIPTSNRGVIVTPERHVLALQVGGDPFAYGWSSRENYLDWDFASTTNTAGRLPVKTEGPLLSLCAVREGTLMWGESQVFLIRYVGQPFIYGHDELGASALYSPNSFAAFDGRAVWMDSQGFMLYDGGSISPLPCTLNDYIFSDIDPVYGPRLAHASANGPFNEVWFFYPSSGSTFCDRVVIWNWEDNWWSMGQLNRSAMAPGGAAPLPLASSDGSAVYQHEEEAFTYTDFDPGSLYIESGVINIDQGGERVMHINQLVPSAGANPDLLRYTLLTRMTPGGAELTFGPYQPRADGYVDTRAQGRDVRIKIQAAGGGDWSIGRIRMNIAAGGKR